MTGTVLMAGASGLVGAACVDAFRNDGWDVIAVSRRAPEVCSDGPFTHPAVDLQDEQAAAMPSAASATSPPSSTRRCLKGPG